MGSGVSDLLGMDVSDDDAGGRVNPLAGIVDAGDGSGGADDRGGRDGDFVDSLDDAFHGEAEIEAAFGEESGGVGVTIYRREVAEAVTAGEIGGIAPVQELELDGVAMWVVANTTFSGMTRQCRIWITALTSRAAC